jgi:hypothetical protein
LGVHRGESGEREREREEQAEFFHRGGAERGGQ